MRTTIAVIVGLIVGGILNFVLLGVGPSVIPVPDGVDPQDVESLKANIHRFEPKHFLFPFLAHASHAFVGSIVAVLVAGRRSLRPGMIVGVVSLVGGIAMAIMLPAPLWVEATDLIVAYLPMAFIGGRLVRKSPSSES